MKRIIVVSVLLLSLTFMSFATGFGRDGKRPLVEGVDEIAGLEREYQFFSLVSYLGFTSQQLDKIVDSVEKTKGDILALENEIKSDLQRALELAKAGETEKAEVKHTQARESAKEMFQIRNDYMDAIKGIVTLEQQEKMIETFQDKMSGRMQRFGENMRDSQRFGQLNDEVKERVQQRGTDLKDSQKPNRVMQNPQDTQKKMIMQKQMGNQRPMEAQKQMIMQKQMGMQMRPDHPFQQNLVERFFQMLLVEENLDMLKEFMASPAMTVQTD